MRRLLSIISILSISTAPFLAGCAKKETHIYHDGHGHHGHRHEREVEIEHDDGEVEVEIERK